MGEIIVTGQTIEQIAEKMGMTVRLKSIVTDDALWEKVWEYCKNLAKFSHAPIALKDYQRMEKYTEDTNLVEAVYQALQGYNPPKESDLMFDTIGHSYGVALLSQSSHERTRTLQYLDTLADDMIQENNSYGSVLYRNMTRLKKSFPDLADLEKKLAGFKDYYKKK